MRREKMPILSKNKAIRALCVGVNCFCVLLCGGFNVVFGRVAKRTMEIYF
jgi:hypothetical protein